MPLEAPNKIIKEAFLKSGKTQEEFAKDCETRQYNISKYIRGKAVPPANLIMLCMHKLGALQKNYGEDVSVEELSQLIKLKLDQPEFRNARRAVYDVVSNF